MNDEKAVAAVGAAGMIGGGVAAPAFRPILTDAAGGHTFTMLGATMR